MRFRLKRSNPLSAAANSYREMNLMSHPVALPPNRFNTALRDGRRQIGVWSGLCSNIASEIVAGAGFDWIAIDTEHAPDEIPGLLSQLHAMSNGTAEPVERCGWNDAVFIKRVLDVGARSLLIPFVQNAEEARRAVAANRYPPRGLRGVSVAPRANLIGRVANFHLRDTKLRVQSRRHRREYYYGPAVARNRQL
jgi:4-hydroxy-2-oxoheptanedioate aldolase